MLGTNVLTHTGTISVHQIKHRNRIKKPTLQTSSTGNCTSDNIKNVIMCKGELIPGSSWPICFIFAFPVMTKWKCLLWKGSNLLEVSYSNIQQINSLLKLYFRPSAEWMSKNAYSFQLCFYTPEENIFSAVKNSAIFSSRSLTLSVHCMALTDRGFIKAFLLMRVNQNHKVVGFKSKTLG